MVRPPVQEDSPTAAERIPTPVSQLTGIATTANPVAPEDPIMAPATPILPAETVELPAPKIRSKAPTDSKTASPPVYHPPKPVSPKVATRPRNADRRPRAVPDRTDLRLYIQLAFDRRGAVRTLALVAERRADIPEEVEVSGAQGNLRLIALRDDCYEAVSFAEVGQALLAGIEWQGQDDASDWRWVMGSRELYVLAPGDESRFGLHGFVSTDRLWLNARHVILATVRLRDVVLGALAAAGCATPTVKDETTPGVPPGWLVICDVLPTRAVVRDTQDVLNALCPAHEIQPHFVGGIRLERNVWLAGFPPRIRFTGELTEGIQVRIDDQPALPAKDGGFEAPNWAANGEHRLWFSDRAETYTLRPMNEDWTDWNAYDFGIGATICGARTHQLADTRWRQVRVNASNPLLLGEQPGEIYHARSRDGTHHQRFIAFCPFRPVWALPLDPAHANKQSARVKLLHPLEPAYALPIPNRTSALGRRWIAWTGAIRQAGSKGLLVEPDTEELHALWRRYHRFAKQLARRIR